MVGVSDRSHPALKQLDALKLTYPGFERDKRDAENILLGRSRLNLGFDAALRRIKVKQRAHEEQKSMPRSYNRTHPNLVSLDALKLTFPGWESEKQAAETAHLKDPKCDFLEILRKLQVKQFRYENDRSHYRLKALDNLKLSYPGCRNDIRELEKFHFEEAFFLAGDSVFQSKIDSLKRRQQIFLKSQQTRASRQIIPQFGTEEDTAHTETTSKEVNNNLSNNMDVINGQPPQLSSSVQSSGSSNQHNPECDEDREDRQKSRAPYAALDTDNDDERSKDISIQTTSKTVTSRPDPPENDLRRVLGTRRQNSIDCEEQRSTTSSKTVASESRDPIEQKPPRIRQQKPRPNRLSAYVYQGAIPEESEEDEEDSYEEVTSEKRDKVAELPRGIYSVPSPGMSTRSAPVFGGRYSASTPGVRSSKNCSSSRSGHSTRTTGRYCAPPLIPFDKDEDPSLYSQASQEVQGSFSLVTSSRNWSVQDDRSTMSYTSSQAVFAEEEDDTVVSASSSRAIWAESPTPYSAPSPVSSTRVVVPPSPETIMVRSRSSNRPSNRNSYSSNSQRIRQPKSHKPRSSSRFYDERSVCSRTSQASTRSKSLGKCTICGDSPKNHVFVACGHLCACKECARQVIARKMACPVCRGRVTEAIQVFF